MKDQKTVRNHSTTSSRSECAYLGRGGGGGMYREYRDIQIPEVLAGKKVSYMSLERSKTNSNEVVNFFF